MTSRNVQQFCQLFESLRLAHRMSQRLFVV